MASEENPRLVDSKKPKRKMDWVGRDVRILHQLETRGGNVFPRGTILRVSRNFGGLELYNILACEKRQQLHRHVIKGINERDVELLLPETPT